MGAGRRVHPLTPAVTILGIGLLACSRDLRIDVMQFPSGLVFSFQDCGLFLRGEEKVEFVSIRRQDGSRGASRLCAGAITPAATWPYGSGLPGCPKLEPGRHYVLEANGLGHKGEIAFSIAPSGVAVSSRSCP